MPRDGSGQYTLPGPPVVTDEPILASEENALRDDMATALTGSVARNGTSIPTGNLPMGTLKHTNVGNATVATEYAAYGQVGWVAISRQVASAAANVSFALPVGFAAFRLEIVQLGVSNTGSLVLRTSFTGGASYDAAAADYAQTLMFTNATAAPQSIVDVTGAHVDVTGGMLATVPWAKVSITIDAGGTGRRASFGSQSFTLSETSNFRVLQTHGTRVANGTATNIQMLPLAGTVSGVFSLMGMV